MLFNSTLNAPVIAGWIQLTNFIFALNVIKKLTFISGDLFLFFYARFIIRQRYIVKRSTYFNDEEMFNSILA